MFVLYQLALLLLFGQTPLAPPPEPFTPARFRAHVAYLASDALEGRDVGSAGETKAIEYIIGHLKECGASGIGAEQEWLQTFGYGKAKGRNILAVVRGKGELGREAILVTAHHDHLGIDPARIKAGKDGIFNGADDNASGCAAVLLIAEALHADRDRLPPSHRTVIFATFDAEERGMLGSRYYVNHPLWPLPRTASNLNFDMVGRLNGGMLLALDGETSAFLAQRILLLAPACGLRVETRLNGVRRSDNASFLDREIPAIHFSTGLHADYHRVTDEVSKIDSDGGARVSWFVYRLLRETMATPGRLRYQRASPAYDVGGILQVLLKLGIIPEQGAQPGRYLPIHWVVPFSPGSRFGLKPGDEVSGINGHEFQRMEEAAILFGQLRFDQGVRFTIRRQGKPMEIKIPAEATKEFTGPRIEANGKDHFEVLFRYKPADKVKSVAVAGTFNNWDAKAQPLVGPAADGWFSARVALKAGVYEYKFIVDGKTWLTDPTNFRTSTGLGNSVLVVSEKP